MYLQILCAALLLGLLFFVVNREGGRRGCQVRNMSSCVHSFRRSSRVLVASGVLCLLLSVCAVANAQGQATAAATGQATNPIQATAALLLSVAGIAGLIGNALSSMNSHKSVRDDLRSLTQTVVQLAMKTPTDNGNNGGNNGG